MSSNSTTKIIFSCFLASTLEIYDFVIFGFLSKPIHENYLSFLDEKMALFVTYIFFAIGFLFRPIGSLIFGYIGDKYGRKKALVTSVSMMGACSLVMCILPPYSYLGILSCYIIILIRIIQGISVGGEFTGAIVFTMEHVKKCKGLAVSILSAGGACGILLASFVSYIIQQDIFPENSWRLAYLLGFSLSLIGYFIRKKLHDTKEFLDAKDKKRIPLFEGLKEYKLESLSTFLVAAANGITFYFGSVFLSKHLNAIKGNQDYGYISLLVSGTMFIALPFFGYISDKFDRKNYQICTASIMSVVAVFLINQITFSSSHSSIVILSIMYTVCGAMMIGGINIYAAEIFPTNIRMSCMSLFYSLGMGLIGGTVPMIATYITSNYKNAEYVLGGYIGLICTLAALSVYMVKLKKIIQLQKSS